MGENHFEQMHLALYGAVLFMAAVALIWLIPDRRIERVTESDDTTLAS